jgi:hypothetical protein
MPSSGVMWMSGYMTPYQTWRLQPLTSQHLAARGRSWHELPCELAAMTSPQSPGLDRRGVHSREPATAT